MDIADLAASAVKKITKGKGKRLAKKGYPEDLPKAKPVKISNKTDDKFDVGFAMKETMPDDFESKTYYIAGHKMAQKMTGFHDPITISAMWIGCGDEGGVMMVCADIIGLTNFEVSIIRASLEEFSSKAKCKAINICCSHTHGGFDTVGYWGKLPKSGKVDTYMQKIFKTVKEVCLEAYDNRKKGDLYIGTTHVPDAQYDKRPPVVLHDTLTRIRFVPDDGSKETWLLNYAAHPNTLGGSNTLCSADYPYFLRQTIYKEKDVNVLFGIGAIGAVDPGYPDIEDRWKRTELQGETLGKAALSIDNDEKMKPEITVVQQPFYFPVGNYVLTLLAMRGTMNTDIYPNDAHDIGLALKSEMTYMKFGSKQMLLLPGEMFPSTVYGGYDEAVESSTGLDPKVNPPALADVANDPDLLVFGVTNDMTGYVVPPNDFVLNKTQPYLNTARDRFDNRHYHETNSLGDKSQLVIEQEFAKIMSRVK